MSRKRNSLVSGLPVHVLEKTEEISADEASESASGEGDWASLFLIQSMLVPSDNPPVLRGRPRGRPRGQPPCRTTTKAVSSNFIRTSLNSSKIQGGCFLCIRNSNFILFF